MQISVYPQSQFIVQGSNVAVDAQTGVISMAIVNNLNVSLSYPFVVMFSLADNTSTAVAVANLTFSGSFDAYSCISLSSGPLASVVAALASPSAYFLVTVPPYVSGSSSAATLTVPLASAVGVSLPDCSIPFTDVVMPLSPNATVYVGDTFTRSYALRSHFSLAFVASMKPNASQLMDYKNNSATFTFTPTQQDVGNNAQREIEIVIGLTDGFTVHSNTTFILSVVSCKPPLVFCQSSNLCLPDTENCAMVTPAPSSSTSSTSSTPSSTSTTATTTPTSASTSASTSGDSTPSPSSGSTTGPDGSASRKKSGEKNTVGIAVGVTFACLAVAAAIAVAIWKREAIANKLYSYRRAPSQTVELTEYDKSDI